jgi:K(+)-stimulated pyrophosphate-energized sodium pump
MVALGAVGNTTKAVTKGFAIGSAVIAAVALFASFIETAGDELNVVARLVKDNAYNLKDGVFKAAELQINVAEPKIFIGLLIGGAVPFLFSAFAIRAVGRTAGVVVQEVRKQFADGKIMKGEKLPEYGPVIDICTEASLRELATPALLAVLTPVVIGFGLDWKALGAFLAAVILVGQLMANYLSNAGGAWDNAKKYIEDGNHGGKGSEAHKAAVTGDTVGDPFKTPPARRSTPLIKVMNLVSLLVLPAIISLEDNLGARLSIAAAALVVLVEAIVFSSRKPSGINAPPRPDHPHSNGAGPCARAPRLSQVALPIVLGLLDFANKWVESGGLVVLAAIVFAESGLLVGFFLPGDSCSSSPASSPARPGAAPARPAVGGAHLCRPPRSSATGQLP